jgi:hypothetical protein
MSSDGVIAAFIFPFRLSFDLEVEDSHNFDVDALGSARVVLGDGNVCVDDPAMGNDVFKGEAYRVRESRTRSLTAGWPRERCC